MSNTIIKVENISKKYNLGTIGAGTLYHTLWNQLDRFRGGKNKKSGKNDEFWALKDINFEVKQGEVLGIIGKNGAGKSTLLKVLSRITEPSSGRIKINGRVASLLEVGTGFHPELTGRENVFLNGGILGMRKAEIKQKFDEIVDFSGVEKFIDTPVKRYSSGMYVRLAFAVAAHLEPEILVIDEVLSVGDAEFQKKCMGKMGEMSGGGRTVLFVSHNMGAVKQLCSGGIMLKSGQIAFRGSTDDCVAEYLAGSMNLKSRQVWELDQAPGNDKIKIKSIIIQPLKGDKITLDSGLKIEFTILNQVAGENLGTTLEIMDENDFCLNHSGFMISENKNSRKGDYRYTAKIAPNILNSGKYRINLIFGINKKFMLVKLEDIASFEVENEDASTIYSKKLPGVLKLDLDWTLLNA